MLIVAIPAGTVETIAFAARWTARIALTDVHLSLEKAVGIIL
jgi:hypothetical protein